MELIQPCYKQYQIHVDILVAHILVPITLVNFQNILIGKYSIGWTCLYFAQLIENHDNREDSIISSNVR